MRTPGKRKGDRQRKEYEVKCSRPAVSSLPHEPGGSKIDIGRTPRRVELRIRKGCRHWVSLRTPAFQPQIYDLGDAK